MTEFISRKYGNEGYEVIINTDCHEHYRASEEFARRLIDHAKPMTKADRIRNMSDEDLAQFLTQVVNGSVDGVLEIVELPPSYMRINYDNYKRNVLSWLQQHVEVE